MFFEIRVLKVSSIHRKTPVLESLFSRVASLEACNFLKKRLQYRCFPVNFAKFLRKFYLRNHTGGCFCTLHSSGIWWYTVYLIGKWMTHIFNIILCITIMCFFIFSISVLLKLWKNCFWEYNECKTKHLFLIKKAVTRFDKNRDMTEKEHWWREESITTDPEEEEPISEDSKKTISLRTLKIILLMRNLKRSPLSLWNLKTTLSMKILRSFRALNDFCAAN